MNFAGLDVGTTGTKVIVVNEYGNLIASAYQNYDLWMPHEGWSELNPDDIWNACKKVLREVALQTNGQIDSIAVSSHAQAVIPIDAKGRTLYNFISTVDTRTEKEFQFWKNTKDEFDYYLKTGLPFSPIYTANKILWLKSNCPTVFSRASRFLCAQDFVNWKLTGRAVMDYSLAGRGMLFNAQQKKWDADILEIIGISPVQLAELLPSGAEVGPLLPEVAAETRLTEGTRIYSGGHDQTCGCIGSGVFKPGQAMNSCGTVEVLEAISSAFITNPEILKFHYPCTPYITGKNYLVMSINNSGGAMLKWYLNTFCEFEKWKAGQTSADPYDQVIQAASKEISNVYVLPHLNGAETPIQDPNSSCAFVHLRANTRKSDITRGLLDSMAYEMRLNKEAFETIGCGIHEIHAIGGGARSPRFLQIKADVLQTPFVALAAKESAALGAAIIGAVGIGAYESYETAIAQMVKIERVYEPNSSLAASYDAHFEEYKLLYPSLANLNHFISNRIRSGFNTL